METITSIEPSQPQDRDNKLTLSLREGEILNHLADHYGVKKIAKKIDMSPQSIKNILSRIYKKFEESGFIPKGIKNKKTVTVVYFLTNQQKFEFK